jgi:hypothetical protein
MNILRICLIPASLFIFLIPLGSVLAIQDYDFNNTQGSTLKQQVIKEIDRFYKAIEFDDIETIEKDEYKQYLKEKY